MKGRYKYNGKKDLDLTTRIAGIKMRSPIGIGAIGIPMIKPERLTPQMHAELLLKHVKAGAGFICLPLSTHVSEEVLQELKKSSKPFEYTWDNPSAPIFMSKQEERADSKGIYFRLGGVLPPEHWAGRFRDETSKIIEILKQENLEETPIIANIQGLGINSETYVTTAKAHEEAGVDMIELDLSCTMPMSSDIADIYTENDFPLFYGGFLIGDQPNLVEIMTRDVVNAVSIPVGVKFSPESGYPRIVELARRVRNSGGMFVNCGNMAASIVPPDIYNKGRTKWPFIDGNPFVAVGGDWLRTIVYKQVAAIARYAPGIDIIATGGLNSPEHIIEAMMLGAKSVQIVTAMLYKGRRSIRKQLSFLKNYMKEQEFNSVDEIIGLGQKYIKHGNEITSEYDQIFAEVDDKKCTGCGLCTDHICLASYIDNGVANVRTEDCFGCGMCVALCPEGAVRMTGGKKE